MSPQPLGGHLTDTRPYEYETLQDKNIRLITIVGLENDTVRCTIEKADLKLKSTYYALSYTWGDPRPKSQQTPGQATTEHWIYLNGRAKMVTSNLRDALIRFASGVLVLGAPIWVDAICINQGYPPEKDSQVLMMDAIYKGASKVIAWLGEADEFTEIGLEATRCLAAFNEGLTAANYITHQQRDLSSYGFGEEHWEGLIAVFSRAWFTRVWVGQEVTFACKLTVLFGEYVVTQEIMQGAATYLSRAGLWFKLTKYVEGVCIVFQCQ